MLNFHLICPADLCFQSAELIRDRGQACLLLGQLNRGLGQLTVELLKNRASIPFGDFQTVLRKAYLGS